MSYLKIIKSKLLKAVIIMFALPVFGLTACADLPAQLSVQSSQKPVKKTSVIVYGGDQILQSWTTHAVQAFCQNKRWPKDILKTTHLPKANHPMFNQPRKTQVLVSQDNTLHIHFQLGGVLMDNYSHELIVHPPTISMCAAAPVHYEVTMQPKGDAVIYISKPQMS